MAPEGSVILALDPATKCGWAVYDGKGGYAAGSWELPKPEGNAQEEGARFLALAKHLTSVRVRYGPISLIVYEVAKNHKSTYAAHLFGGWIATIQLWAHTERNRAEVIDPTKPAYYPLMYSTVKKFATGKGNASKDDMRESMTERTVAMLKQYPPTVFEITLDLTDEDAVDATWILLCGQDMKARGVLGKKKPKKKRKTKAKAGRGPKA